MRRLLIALVALLGAGCFDEKAWIQRFAPPEHDQLARTFLDRLRSSDYTAVHGMIAPAVAAKTQPAELERMGQLLQQGRDPVTVELIGANVGFFKPAGAEATKQSSLTYQIQFANGWLVASFVITSTSEGPRVTTGNLQPIPDSLQVLNRFTFRNKSLIHYLFFSAVVAVLLLNLLALILCVRSKVRRRWLWILFILFAFGKFNLNWSTGEWNVAPVSVLMFGAAYVRASSYAPVIVSFGVPVGAILFLTLRGWLQRRDPPPELPSADETPPRPAP